jgi:signal transduction histidine kinase
MFAEAGTKRAMGGERVLTALRADGEPFPIEAQISSATVSGKRFFTLVIRDVTDGKRAEAERESLLRREREARLAAETASRAKDEFLSVVSHELRNLLTSMLNWLRVLRRTGEPKQVVQTIESMERVVRAQAKLIDDLLDVSRVVTGHQEVWNLLLNAVKFTPPGGLVEIRFETVNGWAHVIVRDTGRGISAQFLPQLFEPFQQADLIATRGHGGLGLGLAIVRHLVELHGGTVEVESAGEGHGATFTVMLPLPDERSPGKLTTDTIAKSL